MGALQAWDDWEVGLDDIVGPDAGPSAPPLEELYGPATLAAIERGAGEPTAAATSRGNGSWRGAAMAMAAGATVAGLARGLRDPAEDDSVETDEVVEPADAIADARLEPVTVVLVPGDPAASVAIVRRWLLPH